MSTDDLPEPPVPADCDLRGIQWIKQPPQMFTHSAEWVCASDKVFRAKVAFWFASLDQVPAGSVPNEAKFCTNVARFDRIY
jgi:hypothetical protein